MGHDTNGDNMAGEDRWSHGSLHRAPWAPIWPTPYSLGLRAGSVRAVSRARWASCKTEHQPPWLPLFSQLVLSSHPSQ